MSGRVVWLEHCEDSLSFYSGNLQTCLEAALIQQRMGPYGKQPHSLSDFSFKLFFVKTVDVEMLRGKVRQGIIPSEARNAPRSLLPLSADRKRGEELVPQWAAHHCLERHQPGFVSKEEMCSQSSGWIYIPTSLWLQMHLTELTDFQTELWEASGRGVYSIHRGV